jgi:O-succinylbenzoate synthase
MPLHFSFVKKIFRFNFKARTSRGLMKDKTSWFIKVNDPLNPGVSGVGECGPLPGLSIDHRGDFEEILHEIIKGIQRSSSDKGMEMLEKSVPPEFPSVRFGLETALLDFHNGGKHIIYNNDFIRGQPISINGLVWMGDMDFMMDQINKKIADGFTCLKLKVGGLDFDRECDIISYIRKRYFRENILIRLDANGGFKADDVFYKLKQLARFDIHSIEQPIKPRLADMEELCRNSPVPVAFDEELIAITSPEEKSRLLKKLKPWYLVLKPTLHGGLQGCEEWIALAESEKIGWWITSALESSIGLNAICQFTANYKNELHQGLGTGTIYENNFGSPLTVKEGKIFWDPALSWEDIEGTGATTPSDAEGNSPGMF